MQPVILERDPALRQQSGRCKATAKQKQNNECNRARHFLPGNIDAGAPDRLDEFVRRQLQRVNCFNEITGIGVL